MYSQTSRNSIRPSGVDHLAISPGDANPVSTVEVAPHQRLASNLLSAEVNRNSKADIVVRGGPLNSLSPYVFVSGEWHRASDIE